MPPSAPPPNFYSNMTSMGAGSGAPPAKTEKDPDDEIIQGFLGIGKVMTKMVEKKPELKEKFGAIREQFKDALATVLKKDPKSMDESAPPPDTVSGNKSPQDLPAAPPPPAEADKVPA